LRSLGRDLLQFPDRRGPVDHGCKIVHVYLVGDDIAPGNDIARLRIPDQVGVIDRLDDFDGRFAGRQLWKVAGAAIKRGNPYRKRASCGRWLRC
jgi:hypothetical protein